MRQSKNSDRDSSSRKPKSLYHELTVALVVLVSLVSLLIIYKHLPNIKRLMAKKELAFSDGSAPKPEKPDDKNS